MISIVKHVNVHTNKKLMTLQFVYAALNLLKLNASASTTCLLCIHLTSAVCILSDVVASCHRFSTDVFTLHWLNWAFKKTVHATLPTNTFFFRRTKEPKIENWISFDISTCGGNRALLEFYTCSCAWHFQYPPFKNTLWRGKSQCLDLVNEIHTKHKGTTHLWSAQWWWSLICLHQISYFPTQKKNCKRA